LCDRAATSVPRCAPTSAHTTRPMSQQPRSSAPRCPGHSEPAQAGLYPVSDTAP